MTSETVTLTDHASVRLQQRGIPVPILGWLLAHGRKIHDHHGSKIVFFDHGARERFRREHGGRAYRRFERKLDAYAVVTTDGVVLTVGRRTKRLNRH